MFPFLEFKACYLVLPISVLILLILFWLSFILFIYFYFFTLDSYTLRSNVLGVELSPPYNKTSRHLINITYSHAKVST